MDTRLKRNLMVAPIVLFVRVPLLTPLYLVELAGEYAGKAADWLRNKLPGFRLD